MACKCYHAEKNYIGRIGVCWGTKECEACSCGGNEAKCDFYEEVRQRVKKPQTNADRIRMMSDEELAETYAGGCPDGDRLNCGKYYLHGGRDCFNCWLDWLKSPVRS
jgi:hypothetical protein